MKNKARRHHRENQKKKAQDPAAAAAIADSPSSTPTEPGAKALKKKTPRKCANCGQMGHIKTNKKYCDTCSLTVGPLAKFRR